MTRPFHLCLGSLSIALSLVLRSNDVCLPRLDVYYAAVASLVRFLALSALRNLIVTAGTIVFIIPDTTMAMLLLLDLSMINASEVSESFNTVKHMSIGAGI